ALFVSWLERCRCHHDPSFAVAVEGLPANRLPRKAKHIFAPDLLTRFDESHAPVERPRDGVVGLQRDDDLRAPWFLPDPVNSLLQRGATIAPSLVPFEIGRAHV